MQSRRAPRPTLTCEQCEHASGDLSLKKLKWWEDLARGFPGTNAKGLQQRWMQIRNLPGLEYKTFTASVANPRVPPQRTASEKAGSDSLATKAGYGGQRTAAGRSGGFAGAVERAAAQAGGAASRRPVSASAMRISATQQSAAGRLRTAALASSHTPVLAFSKNKPPGGGERLSSPNRGEKSSGNADAGSGGGDEGGAGGAGGAGCTKDTNDGSAGSGAGGAAGGSGGAAAGNVKSEKDNGGENLIVIHVCDENRGINRDFTCRKDVLLSEMAYFRSYLNGSESCDDIDISVHCDIQIFQWLIKYLNEPNSPPPLDTSNVISILISSQFLKMASLVDMCLTYVCANLNDILKMPLDLNCLNQELLSKLSGMLTVDMLDELVDRKDKLVCLCQQHCNALRAHTDERYLTASSWLQAGVDV